MYAYPEHYGNIIIRPVSMYKRVLECSDIEKICYQSLTDSQSTTLLMFTQVCNNNAVDPCGKKHALKSLTQYMLT